MRRVTDRNTYATFLFKTYEWQKEQCRDLCDPKPWLAYRRVLNTLNASFIDLVLDWARDCMLRPDLLCLNNAQLYQLLSQPWIHYNHTNGLSQADNAWTLMPLRAQWDDFHFVEVCLASEEQVSLL